MPNKRTKPTQDDNPPPQHLCWEFPPNIPTSDFLEGRDPADHGALELILDDFLWIMEQKEFLTWEAVVCEERGIPLSRSQKDALGDLFSFGDSDEILYISEMARPSLPWHEIFHIIATNLLIDGPIETSVAHDIVVFEGWLRLKRCVVEHATDLSLPQGMQSALDVIPEEIVHRLDLQSCFDALSDLGCGKETASDREDLEECIGWFIKWLGQASEAVAYFNLTLDSLLERIQLPEQDLPLFVELMTRRLGLKSSQEPLVDRLHVAKADNRQS